MPLIVSTGSGADNVFGGSWNDQISSIQVLAGVWEFYEHADYKGEMVRYEPGAYNLEPRWNDRISSLRCIQPTGQPTR